MAGAVSDELVGRGLFWRCVSRTLRVAFIFEVIIIRYDKEAHDRETVHMIITRA